MGFEFWANCLSGWGLSFDPFMAFDILPCHLSLHVSKQRDPFFLYLCFERWLHSTSPPPIFCKRQCHHPHDFHTHTWSFTSIKFTKSKKVGGGWSSCNTKFDVGWFFFGTFVSPCCKWVWWKLGYINSTKKCIM